MGWVTIGVCPGRAKWPTDVLKARIDQGKVNGPSAAYAVIGQVNASDHGRPKTPTAGCDIIAACRQVMGENYECF
jgi:hypothetical protein